MSDSPTRAELAHLIGLNAVALWRATRAQNLDELSNPVIGDLAVEITHSWAHRDTFPIPEAVGYITEIVGGENAGMWASAETVKIRRLDDDTIQPWHNAAFIKAVS